MGTPRNSTPARVRDDVLDGYVTPEAARTEYGFSGCLAETTLVTDGKANGGQGRSRRRMPSTPAAEKPRTVGRCHHRRRNTRRPLRTRRKAPVVARARAGARGKRGGNPRSTGILERAGIVSVKRGARGGTFVKTRWIPREVIAEIEGKTYESMKRSRYPDHSREPTALARRRRRTEETSTRYTLSSRSCPASWTTKTSSSRSTSSSTFG